MKETSPAGSFFVGGAAQAFTAWARFGVDRAARQLLGSPVAQIETFGSYADDGATAARDAVNAAATAFPKCRASIRARSC